MSTLILDNIWGLFRTGNDEQRQEPVESESTAIDARVSMYPIGENHPLVSTFGVFENEPLWDELLRAMNENRQEQRLQELADSFGE